MGAAASIADGPVTKDAARDLAGSEWGALEEQFDRDADAAGCVTAARVREFAENRGAAAEEGENPVKKNKSMWRYMRLAAQIVTLSSITKKDMQDETVIAMMKLIDGNDALAEQNIGEKIRCANHRRNPTPFFLSWGAGFASHRRNPTPFFLSWIPG